jgi:hypothetical protein
VKPTSKPPLPNATMEDIEFNHAFYSFCTFCHLYYGKKINFATIFTKIITTSKIKRLYKLAIDESSDFEALRKFMLIEPSITKSKYITKIINKNKVNLNE